MNLNYAHCFDFTEKCPEECFRAQLERELSRKEGDGKPRTIEYVHFKGTRRCLIAGGESQ